LPVSHLIAVAFNLTTFVQAAPAIVTLTPLLPVVAAAESERGSDVDVTTCCRIPLDISLLAPPAIAPSCQADGSMFLTDSTTGVPPSVLPLLGVMSVTAGVRSGL